ncbi:polyketide cyclase [Yimella sp. cx-573]|nr:polyketide cyclase [Yimella sp. cx-573]
MNHHKSDDQKIVVHRTIEAPADAIFDVVTNPRRHKEFDGSGFIRSEEHGDRITATGQVFTMNMEGEHMGGEYKTDNHVTGYAHDRLVAWQTAPAGTEPKGWEWVWELEPQGQHQTEVTLTYDWSKVTDKELLRKVTFPLIKKEELEHSLQRLAETV